MNLSPVYQQCHVILQECPLQNMHVLYHNYFLLWFPNYEDENIFIHTV